MSAPCLARPPLAVPPRACGAAAFAALLALSSHSARAAGGACPDAHACTAQVILLADNGKTLLRYAAGNPVPIKSLIPGCQMQETDLRLLSSGADLLLFGGNSAGTRGRICRMGQGQSIPMASPLGPRSIGGGFDLANTPAQLIMAWADASHLAVIENPGSSPTGVRFYNALPRNAGGDLQLIKEAPTGWPSASIEWNSRIQGSEKRYPNLLINAGTAQLMLAKTSLSWVLNLTVSETGAGIDVSENAIRYETDNTQAKIAGLIPLAPHPLSFLPANRLARRTGAIALMEPNGSKAGIAFISPMPGSQSVVVDSSTVYMGAAVAWLLPRREMTGAESKAVLITSYQSAGQYCLAATVLTNDPRTLDEAKPLLTNRVPICQRDRLGEVAIVPAEPPASYIPFKPPSRFAVLAVSNPRPLWYKLTVPETGKPVWDPGAPTAVSLDGSVPVGGTFEAPRPLMSLGSERWIRLGSATLGSQRGDLPLVALGQTNEVTNSGRVLDISGGDCASTTVRLVTRRGMADEKVEDLLVPPIPFARRPIPTLPADPNLSQVLRFEQSVASGEDCTMRLASSDSVSMYTTAALVRIQGSSLSEQALALALDRSASMKTVIPQGPDAAPYTHADAQLNALQGFAELLRLMPDAKNLEILLAPFGSVAGDVIKTTGHELKDEIPNLRAKLLPQGSTNLLAGLKAAAAALVKSQKQHKSLMLITDGRQNVDEGGPMPGPTSEQSLETAGAAALRGAITDHFLPVGISPYAEHQALNRLVQRVAGSKTGPHYEAAGRMLESAFTNALWELMSAILLARSEDVLPAGVRENPEASTRRVTTTITPVDREIFITAVGENADSKLALSLWFNGKRIGGYGIGYCTPQRSDSPVGTRFTACRLSQEALPAQSGQLEIALTNIGDHPTRYRVEIAARSNLRMSATFAQSTDVDQPLFTGQPITVDVALKSYNLPVGQATLSARIRRPKRSLGTSLAGSRMGGDASALPDLAQSEDSSPLLEKVQHLVTEDPNLQEQEEEKAVPLVSMAPAGQEGTYQLSFEPHVAGLYEIEVLAELKDGSSGSMQRSQVFRVHVEPNLDCNHSVREFVLDRSSGQGGLLSLGLVPQDVYGNLLGPGNKAELRFEQPANAGLSWIVEEAPSLNGSYSIRLSNLQNGPVYLVTSAGNCEVKEPRPSSFGPNGSCPGGCCCNLSARAGDSASPRAWVGLLLLLIPVLRRINERRRARAPRARAAA